MVNLEEESFPRGGKKVKISTKKPKRDDILFFEKPKAKRVKRSRKSQKGDASESSNQISLDIQGTLSYNKLQDGMVILGCIRHITDFSIEVELPGLTFGRINITNISDSFTKYLNEKLEENDGENDVGLKKMFKVGQFVAVKVLSIENTDKGKHVTCSMNPKDINHEKVHDSFKKGMLIWASVQSVLDHGYEINLGVKNCRVFLPSKNVNEEKVFTIGEPLWCVIHKSESTNSVTTLRVSSKEQHIKATKTEEIDSLDNLIPGMQVEFLIEKVRSTGIQGKFINDYLGYVDGTQLHPLKSLDDYKEGKLVTAFVLYVEPAAKITHLTLRNLDTVPMPRYINGDIVTAEVLSKVHNGLFFKLSTDEKCFVSNKRILNSLSKNSNIDIFKTIHTKFPPGSKHTCRILDYSNMSRVYVCGIEQAILKEKIFSNRDIQIGQLVTVTVVSIKAEGLVVLSGHVRGFVPNLHISNVTYTENLKKKFKEGCKINARVLTIDDDNVIFTLKPSLVESEKCLTDLEQAKRGEQYMGVVVQMKSSGVYVIFYGGIKGWISKKNLIQTDDNEDFDPARYFFRGQVINPWVVGVKGEKVILTLKQPFALKKLNIKVGQRIKGIISKIHKDRIDVKSVQGKIIGTIPINHLSCSQALCPAILKTYKTGDEIKDLMCIYSKDQSVILSRREAMIFSKPKKHRLRKFEDIKPGTLLRCSYMSNCDAGIYVLPLILDYTENILIKTKDIVNVWESLPRFKYHQSILAKVLDIKHESKEIILTAKFSEVFNNSVETTVNSFSQYLADLKYLRQFGYENEWELCQYQPGERVMCKIEQLGDEGGCLVTLPNNVKALVAPRLCPENIQPGQVMEGVFLSQDFQDNYAEVCLKQDISQRINKVQDGVLNTSSLSSCIAETVIIKSDSVLAVLKQENCRRQFVYIPLYLSENDNNGCRKYYEEEKFKICICGKVGKYLIGMSKKLFLTLDKQKIRTKKNKILIDEKAVTNKTPTNGNKVSESFNLTSNGLHSEDIDSDMLEEESEELNVFETEKQSPKDLTKKESILQTNSSGVKRKRDEIVSSKNINFGDTSVKNFATNDSITGPLPVLPGVSSFFNLDSEVKSELSSDEEQEGMSVKKKKKLTPAERAQLARQEEERISKIEKELADPTNSPKNAEQFDRLLLAHPNSSELWTKYMSFHIAATEFDKARSVAKRALDSINMTLTEERFNIWVALLNLENMLGTKESFEKTFEEAVRCNDSLQIYLKAIELLADANKYTEMEEKIRKVKNKHKHEPNMWHEVAKILYTSNKLKEARNIKEAALKSIHDKKTQFSLIVRFAILEFKYGEEEQGVAIFETILSSDPRKVSVWTTYVDQLVNKGRIDEARQVLERAICQRLPLKSMKTLFLKFRMFEEKHGTPQSVEAVKEKAKEYYVAKTVDK